MAKSTKGAEKIKINFGKRKGGAPQKSYNKHSPRPKKYKGQGR